MSKSLYRLHERVFLWFVDHVILKISDRIYKREEARRIAAALPAGTKVILSCKCSPPGDRCRKPYIVDRFDPDANDYHLIADGWSTPHNDDMAKQFGHSWPPTEYAKREQLEVVK